MGRDREIPETNEFSGEGNGTPLQYSCLENPMDGGAWRAAVHGVVKSQTRLKQISTSSSPIIYSNYHVLFSLSVKRITLGLGGCTCILCAIIKVKQKSRPWSPSPPTGAHTGPQSFPVWPSVPTASLI